jgi:hypothetical protein
MIHDLPINIIEYDLHTFTSIILPTITHDPPYESIRSLQTHQGVTSAKEAAGNSGDNLGATMKDVRSRFNAFK